MDTTARREANLICTILLKLVFSDHCAEGYGSPLRWSVRIPLNFSETLVGHKWCTFIVVIIIRHHFCYVPLAYISEGQWISYRG
jgi:hypothetical protein